MAADQLDPYGVDFDAIARKQKLAQLMIGQGMDMSPILSPWQGLARVAQAITGNMQMRDADNEAKALATRRQTDRSSEIGRVMSEAEGGNTARLARLLAQSNDPMFQNLGLSMALKTKEEEYGTEPQKVVGPDGKPALAVFSKRGTMKPLPGLTPYEKPQKPPEAIQTFEAALAAAGIDKNSEQGQKMFREYAARLATHAPGTNVTVNTGKKFGETLAHEVAQQVAQSAETARGAVDTLQTAKQISAALESGKVMAGPGTSAIMFVQQAIGAPSTQEGLVQTRQVIQGLSQMTLNSRKSLKGQGQISDFEGKLLAKAASGDIDSLTVPEIKAIVATSVRLSQSVLQQHQANVKRIAADPELKQLAPFFDVQQPSGPQTFKFDAQGNLLQ